MCRKRVPSTGMNIFRTTRTKSAPKPATTLPVFCSHRFHGRSPVCVPCPLPRSYCSTNPWVTRGFRNRCLNASAERGALGSRVLSAGGSPGQALAPPKHQVTPGKPPCGRIPHLRRHLTRTSASLRRTLQTEEAGRDSPTFSRTRQDSQLLFVPLKTPPRSFNPRNGWGMITLKRKDWRKQDYGGF